MKELKSPIFYHPDDCDCVECLARREPGGLDHDPSNDDAEFEKHEEEMEEKPIVFTREFKIGMTIKFNHMNNFTGDEIELSGIVKGFGPAVRKKWPTEMAEAPDSMMLVRREDNQGQEFFHALMPFEILDLPFIKET